MTTAWVLLGAAIAVEVVATAILPHSEGFTRPGWTALVLGGYAISFLLLANVVRTVPVSVAYAIWSGAGTALIAAIGVTLLGERLDAFKAIGITCVVVGVVLLNLHTTAH